MSRLSKTNIEYGDLAWNFYSGCKHTRDICAVSSNCWAHGTVNRFKLHYPNGWAPTFYPESFLAPLSVKKPSVILCAFMGDLFGDWVNPEEMITVPMVSGLSQAEGLKYQIFRTIEKCPQHRFLFLTKAPWNYKKWGEFPDNVWVGLSGCHFRDFTSPLYANLAKVNAKHKWLSIEPMYEYVPLKARDLIDCGIQWVVVGGQTRPNVLPKVEWLLEIASACDEAKIPVWFKNNLNLGIPRQERPFLPKDNNNDN